MAAITPVVVFLLDKLISTMDQQFLLCGEILTAARQKRAVLSVGRRGEAEAVQKEMDELARLGAREESLVQQAESLENERAALAADLAVQLGLQPAPQPRVASLTLRELIDALRQLVGDGAGTGADELQRLQELQRNLGDVLAEVGRVNELNGTLLRQSLAYIDFNVNLLTGALDTASYDYGSVIGGKTDGANRKAGSGSRKPAIFDVRA